MRGRNAEEPEFFHQNRKKLKKGGIGKARGAWSSPKASKQAMRRPGETYAVPEI